MGTEVLGTGSGVGFGVGLVCKLNAVRCRVFQFLSHKTRRKCKQTPPESSANQKVTVSQFK